MTRYRIKDVARINARTLPEDTSADFSFRYIDISSVDNLGNVNIPVEEISFDDAPSRARRVAPPGAVAVSTVRTYLKAIAPVPSSEFQLVFSTGFAMLEGRAGVDQRYLAYHCRSQQFVDEIVARSTGVSYPAINASEIGNLPIDLPGIEQQRRIADFLDGETARADLFAGKRAAQKAALEELEFSLIAETLSGGENRGGSGRPTGMSWLPWIPSDWKIGPVYGYFSTELGKMLNPERAAGGSQRPYLRNANVHWYSIDASDMATMSFDESEARRYSVKPGDLLVCEGGAGVAEAAVWSGEIPECYYQKSLHRVRRSGPLPVEWLMFWLRLAKRVGVFEADGNIATIPHLTGEQLREYRIPIPPDGDRRVAALMQDVRDLQTVMGKIDHGQSLLAERRQALITAAVTGQLDVTTARPAYDRGL